MRVALLNISCHFSLIVFCGPFFSGPFPLPNVIYIYVYKDILPFTRNCRDFICLALLPTLFKCMRMWRKTWKTTTGHGTVLAMHNFQVTIVNSSQWLQQWLSCERNTNVLVRKWIFLPEDFYSLVIFNPKSEFAIWWILSNFGEDRNNLSFNNVK